MITRHLEMPLRGRGQTLIIEESDVALDGDHAVISVRLHDRFEMPLQVIQLTVEAADALRRGLTALEVQNEVEAINNNPKKVLRHNPHTHKQGRSK